MDLMQNKIKLGELMKHPTAGVLLKKEFPEWANSPLLKMASKMTLEDILKIAKKRVPQTKIDAVLEKLKAL